MAASPSPAQVRQMGRWLQLTLQQRDRYGWRRTNAGEYARQAQTAPESLLGPKLETFVAICAAEGVTPEPQP